MAQTTANREQINDMKRVVDAKPVVVNGMPFDCTLEDLSRMEIIGKSNLDVTILWTLANNKDISLTGKELLTIRDEIIAILGTRMVKVHELSRAFKDHPVTLREIQSPQWINKLSSV